jgi:hypothetical protein
MTKAKRLQAWSCGVLWVAVAMIVLPASAASQDANSVTFSSVAPILNANCVECHRPGSVAPMSLLTYEDARPWASLIKYNVESRIMPPWPLDVGAGIQSFKNDRSLSREDIQTIVQWVDAGSPQGDPADLPPPLDLPDWNDQWAFEEELGRPPDVYVVSPEYTVIANGMDQWPSITPVEITQELGVTGDRWIRAVELRATEPEFYYVFHHGSARVINRESGDVYQGPGTRQAGPEIRNSQRDQLAEAAVGVKGAIYPEGTGRLLKEGDQVLFNPHFYPGNLDEDLRDVSLTVGVWLYPEGEVPRPTEGDIVFDQTSMPGMEDNPLIIPPNSQAIYKAVERLDGNAMVHSLRGHMHLLGGYNILEVVYPDGRYELINKLDWDQRWHTQFLYEDNARPLLPKGTLVMITTVFDNTVNNGQNPDPDQWVLGRSRTVDEMWRLRLGMTYYNDEDFARLVEEREGRPIALR